MLNGTAISGAIQPAYTLTNPASLQSGNYTVAASNASGSATSPPPALLLVQGAYSTATLAGRAGSPSAADGLGGNARFFLPAGAAVDAAGNVYVADTGNSAIRKITPNGLVTTLAGLGGTPGSSDGAGAGARFNLPKGVALDAEGNLYVADTGNQTIRRITPEGVASTIAGQAGERGFSDGAGGLARFFNPAGLALDSSANTYVADSGNNTIRKITPSGSVTTLAGARVPDYTDGASNVARFFNPAGLVLDSSNNIYVADTGNSVIRKLTPNGQVSTIAGQALTPGTTDAWGTNALFNRPAGIAIDPSANLYVSDAGNNSLRLLAAAGAVVTLAGSSYIGFTGDTNAGAADGLGGAARFNSPAGLAVDGGGALYVADMGNHTIRKAIPFASVAAPTIVAQPQNATAIVGSVASFQAVVAGSQPLNFLWHFKGQGLAATAEASLNLTNVQPSQAGIYTLVVSNLGGSVTSAGVLLTLTSDVERGILQPTRDAGKFTLSIGTQMGREYTFEYEDDLTLPSWTVIRSVAGRGNVVTITDLGASPATRFYRVAFQ